MCTPSETIRDRVEQLEFATLKAQLDDVSAKVKALGPQPGLPPAVKDLLPLVTPIVVAFIGIWATTSVTSELEQRRLELTELNDTLSLFKALGDPNVSLTNAKAEGAALAAFGPSAIGPLILQLQVEGQVHPLAAEYAMRAIAFEHPDEVCARLLAVLRNKSRFFTWKTHKQVIVMLGDIGCDDASGELQKLKEMLSGSDALESYKQCVSADAAPTVGDIDKLKEVVDVAIAKLQSR